MLIIFKFQLYSTEEPNAWCNASDYKNKRNKEKENKNEQTEKQARVFVPVFY